MLNYTRDCTRVDEKEKDILKRFENENQEKKKRVFKIL